MVGMSRCLQSSCIHSSSTVEIENVRCRPTDAGRGAEERASLPGFAFVRSGVFIKHVNAREIVADANHVIFFDRDQDYRISHPLPGGDDCTALSFDPHVFRDAVAEFAPRRADKPDEFLPFQHGPNDATACMTYQLLRRELNTSPESGLGADEISVALLGAVLGSAFRMHGSRPARMRASTRKAHEHWVDHAKLYLSETFCNGPSLATIAGAVHCSEFHLVRIFKRATGLSLHRYIIRLRLREALNRIMDGASNLTELALHLGFSSHSHLTDAFRAEFGLAPSSARNGLSISRLREMSKILEV